MAAGERNENEDLEKKVKIALKRGKRPQNCIFLG